MMTRKGIAQTLLAVLALLNPVADAAASALLALPATVAMLLELEVRPFAIAHRGFGENLTDLTQPFENTLGAVTEGYAVGASVVEVDVQLTVDGRVAVFHDDFLPDLTCVNRLTLEQLNAALSRPKDDMLKVPTLREVLEVARGANDETRPLSGLLIVELKAPAPLCDPHDTQERALVSAVVDEIRALEMSEQVILTSFSPALLSIAREQAPEIVRALAASGLQFLSKKQIEAQLDVEVTRIDKALDLGLRWAEIGAIFRLPGYANLHQLLQTAEAVDARIIEADLLLLGSKRGAHLARRAHRQGLKVFGFTATTPEEWFLLESLGVDAIYVNDVPFGVRHQAPIPAAAGGGAMTGAR